MEWTGLNELREKYLSFFESKGHLRLPSFSLVPQGDKSLLLINAGMAPLKKYFTGELTPPRTRVTTCQKCIRTPDIERVGITARHGTFFEMLGNFSFGDYFKHEATAWAWEFCTKVLEMPADKIYISVYQDDDEAYDIWTKELGVSPDHMVRLGKEDNFWEHGAGPCGPCSELYFDRGEKYGCGSPTCGVGCDCDRYVEFWNLVFTQFDNDGNNNYTRLKSCNIDTGMGLERLACIMQGVDNLFEVDTVQNIMKHIMQIAGVKYHEDEKKDVSLRVITDHIRSTTFMIGDGVMPSNEGRGYVLRRLLRRAARHGRLLGIDGTFLYKVCETVIKENETAYPNLVEKHDLIVKVIKAEEESFNKTIDTGLNLLENIIAQSDSKVLSGADAFKLQDTFGFPIDLTKELLEERGMSVDIDEYDRLYAQSRAAARAARKDAGAQAWKDSNVSFKDVGATEFVGYTDYSCDAEIKAIVTNGERAEFATSDSEVVIVLNKTPFYGESGGQAGDTGVIKTDNATLEVTATGKTPDGVVLHIARFISGDSIALGDKVHAQIDVEKREATRRNHTAAHLLQAALRKHLGSHVEQAGQLVNSEEMRFDFTHFSAVTPTEIMDVSNEVMDMILNGDEVQTLVLPIEEAKKLGATALFGEKYGDTVRVVKMGDDSLEFCGGTHLDNTAKVGPFRIQSEASVASGVRRIDAYTGKKVLQQTENFNRTILSAAEELKTMPKDLLTRAHGVMSEIKELKQNVDRMKDKLFCGEVDQVLFSSKNVGGLRVLTCVREDIAPNDLRKMGDRIRDKAPDAVAVLAGIQGEKITILAVCGREAVAKGVKAGALVKEVCTACGGSGGGKPDSAMGGGKELGKLDNALALVDDFVTANVKA